MKKLCSFLIAIVLICGNSGAAIPENFLITKIQSSLRTGDASELASLFNKKIELIIDSEQVEFNQIANDHAEFILKAFFRKKTPKDFLVSFKGNDPQKQFFSGTYVTDSENFRVYVLLKRKEGQFLIDTIHFRKDSYRNNSIIGD